MAETNTSFRASPDLKPLVLELETLNVEKLKNKVRPLNKSNITSDEIDQINTALTEISSVFTKVLEEILPKIVDKINKVTEQDLDQTQESLNIFQETFTNFTKSISLQSNFNAFIATNVSINPSESARIQHFLGVIPKWRVILRQTGNGVVTDVNTEWNETYITLKNNGTEVVVISVFIARE
jgi:hypothetical protein